MKQATTMATNNVLPASRRKIKYSWMQASEGHRLFTKDANRSFKWNCRRDAGSTLCGAFAQFSYNSFTSPEHKQRNIQARLKGITA